MQVFKKSKKQRNNYLFIKTVAQTLRSTKNRGSFRAVLNI